MYTKGPVPKGWKEYKMKDLALIDNKSLWIIHQMTTNSGIFH